MWVSSGLGAVVLTSYIRPTSTDSPRDSRTYITGFRHDSDLKMWPKPTNTFQSHEEEMTNPRRNLLALVLPTAVAEWPRISGGASAVSSIGNSMLTTILEACKAETELTCLKTESTEPRSVENLFQSRLLGMRSSLPGRMDLLRLRTSGLAPAERRLL